MPSIDRPPAEGNLGTGAVRTRAATEPPPPPGTPRLGYYFDPLPQDVYDEYRAGWLKPIDLAVVLEMIRWGARRGRRDSCWTCRKVIADAIDRHPRTVQSSWARLTRRGWIRRNTFEGDDRTDPDDPGNYTGSRIEFLWVNDRRRPRDPAEVPPPRRPRGRPPKSADGPAGEIISPPREIHSRATTTADPATSISPPPGKSASPKGEDPTSKRDRETFERCDGSRPGEDGTAAARVRPMSDSEVSPPSDGEIPPAAAAPAPDGEIPPAAAPPTPAAAWTPRERAGQILARHGDRGTYFRLVAGPDGGEVIQPYRNDGRAPDLSAGERDELIGLRPQIVESLKGRAGPGSAARAAPDQAERPTPPAGGPAAPKVPRAVRDRGSALIGRLAGDPDPASEAEAARGLCEALSDRGGESARTLLGLAGDVRRGVLAEDCLQWAWELACRAKLGGVPVRNRGAVFIWAVKRWKREHRPGRGSP